MKLYTEEQVKMLLEKMSLLTERKNLGVSANFRHRAIEIDKLLKELTPIELPSDEEISKESMDLYGVNSTHVNHILQYKAFKRGAKYVIDKIQGDKSEESSSIFLGISHGKSTNEPSENDYINQPLKNKSEIL